jgi:hypothetical protein
VSRFENNNKNCNHKMTYRRITGLYDTIAPFYNMSGNQESISNSDMISLECYHSKIYTTTSPVELSIGPGHQSGQLKKMTFVHKGSEQGNVTINCLSLPGILSKIELVNVGDSVLLLYTGGIWIVLETLNYNDVTLRSPIVS